MHGVAQIVKDLGAKTNARKLTKAAEVYENASVRRLGYLLEQAGYQLQATALQPFVKKAKTSLLLDPSVKPLLSSIAGTTLRASKWKLVINDSVEADS